MSRLRIQYSTTCTLHVDDNVHSMFQCQPLEDFILGREKSVCEFLGRFSDSHSGTEKGGDFLQGRALVTEIELGLEYCKKLEKIVCYLIGIFSFRFCLSHKSINCACIDGNKKGESIRREGIAFPIKRIPNTQKNLFFFFLVLSR